MFATVVCAIARGSRQRMLQLAPNGSLHLVHAVEGLPSPASPDDWAPPRPDFRKLCGRQTLLLRYTSARAPVCGHPSQVIGAVVKETVADLVVIAFHRDDVLDRVFGSVVDHVVQRAPCSVLVLRATR